MPVTDLFRRSLRQLLEKDIPGWVGPRAEDGVMEFPFAPDGWPRRLEGNYWNPVGVLEPGADFPGSRR